MKQIYILAFASVMVASCSSSQKVSKAEMDKVQQQLNAVKAELEAQKQENVRLHQEVEVLRRATGLGPDNKLELEGIQMDQIKERQQRTRHEMERLRRENAELRQKIKGLEESNQ